MEDFTGLTENPSWMASVSAATIVSASPNVTKPNCPEEPSEQRGRIDSERAGDPGDNQVARVRRAAFDSPDVVFVNLREFGQLLLRETTFVP